MLHSGKFKEPCYLEATKALQNRVGSNQPDDDTREFPFESSQNRPCHKKYSMPPSILPSTHSMQESVSQKKRHPMPRPTGPREQELIHATCCMRCDARCACPFPVYTKICIMLCPDASGGRGP